MPKAQRFPYKMQFWTTQEHANAIEAIANEQMLDVSDVLRQGTMLVLRHYGVAPQTQRLNGHAAQPPATISQRSL